MSEINELLEQYAAGPQLVAAALAGATLEAQNYHPAEDKWSVRQLVAHLADSELEASVRFRFILAEDNPQLTASDQNAWAQRLKYSDEDPQESLELFRHLRRRNYELLKDLDAETFLRSGNHPKRGTVTLLDLLRIYAKHAEKHAQQIRAARQAYENSRA